jgi:hypothetical protein
VAQTWPWGACKGLFLLLLVKDRRMADCQPYGDGSGETTVDDGSWAPPRATSLCGTEHLWMDAPPGHADATYEHPRLLLAAVVVDS